MRMRCEMCAQAAQAQAFDSGGGGAYLEPPLSTGAASGVACSRGVPGSLLDSGVLGGDSPESSGGGKDSAPLSLSSSARRQAAGTRTRSATKPPHALGPHLSRRVCARGGMRYAASGLTLTYDGDAGLAELYVLLGRLLEHLLQRPRDEDVHGALLQLVHGKRAR